jgi:hypothetical protein
MKNQIKLSAGIAIMMLFMACSTTKTTTSGNKAQLLNDNTFVLTELSTDVSYGYTAKNPIKVGGVASSQGPKNERRFLNALAGPNGEKISYIREGSCCEFNSKYGFMGKGLLDIYTVKWAGQSKPISIYINMYDYEPIKAPVGFTINQ